MILESTITCPECGLQKIETAYLKLVYNMIPLNLWP